MLFTWVSWRTSLAVMLDSLKPGAQVWLVTKVTQGGSNTFRHNFMGQSPVFNHSWPTFLGTLHWPSVITCEKWSKSVFNDQSLNPLQMLSWDFTSPPLIIGVIRSLQRAQITVEILWEVPRSAKCLLELLCCWISKKKIALATSNSALGYNLSSLYL